MQKTELIIVGAGRAGLQAALAAHRKKRRDILVLEQEPVTSIPWPKLPGLCLETDATALSLNNRKQLTFTGPHVGYQQIHAEAVILATGNIPIPDPNNFIPFRYPDVSLCLNTEIQQSPASHGPLVTEMLETSLRGVFACGDILFIHDDPQSIDAEGALAGTAAATYLKTGLFRTPSFPVETNGLLAYAMPSQICPSNLSETLTITLCASQPGKVLRIFRDHVIWKEIPWPDQPYRRQFLICLDKKELLSLRYRLTFELR